MFTDFDDAFQKMHQRTSEIEIPNEIIKTISDELPDNLMYKQVANKPIVHLVTKNTKSPMQVSVSIQITDDMKNISSENVPEYLYRNQKAIEIDSDQTIIVNGHKLKVSSFIKQPFDPSFKTPLILAPEPFPEPHQVKLSSSDKNNNVNVKLSFQRVPFNSLNKIKIESIDDYPFKVIWVISERNNSATIKFKINLEKAKSVLDIVNTRNLYHAFLNGTILFSGNKITAEHKKVEGDISLEKLMEFWSKAYLVSKELNLEFDPHKMVSQNDAYLIEAIYRSLIEKKPFRENAEMNSINFNNLKGTTKNDLLSADDLCISFNQTDELDILEQKFKLNKVVFWYHINISGFKKNEKGETVYLIKNIRGKAMYSSNMYIKDPSNSSPSQFFKNRKIQDKFIKATEIDIEKL
ncbi:abortive infection system toxin AbiGii family protein [Sporolactobacillus terrae]|uniref:abortive infection system toxin AbiGii family protein n=1 Tax=Sporolactobacillus terrae TaxID=269673 RepID=UPI00048C7628|nr:abortive infection system toxin AbiGii family protein [Sporolactobacillus terrae]